MYIITSKTEKDAVVLFHGSEVFHEALKTGAPCCRVVNEDGTEYGLLYARNMDLVPSGLREAKKGIDLYPDYRDYDETDTQYLDLSLLCDHPYICFSSLNEYAIVLARLALALTKAEVYFQDPFVRHFLGDHPRLHAAEPVPEVPKEQILRAVDHFVTGVLENSFHVIGIVPLFHSVFFWQSLTEKPIANIRYARVAMARQVGIGGVLAYYSNIVRLFKEKGITAILKENGSRYPDTMLRRYFQFQKEGPDAGPDNTIEIPDLSSVMFTYGYFRNVREIDTSILSGRFRNEMEEYAEAVLGGHRVLGVLIRGTDYIVLNMDGDRRMATVDEMIPVIREWIREDHYDLVFLATEDQDIFRRMHQEFGRMLRVIAQRRRSVSDFKDGIRLLSELEEAQKDAPDAQEIVEDNMVNYFYALYCLSRCDSFMASGNCHGWSVVNSFKEGDFRRCYKFAVGLEK